MGKKYIIELNEDCQSEFKGIMAIGVTQEKQSSVELIPEEELTPYTEPDLEQVKADVWKCAGKIAYMYSEERKKVFGENLIQNIYDIYSASEAIEKIRQYEQEKEEIKVGDEVIIRYKKAVVTEITDRFVRIMYSDGSGYALFSKDMTKTGRHFPEIAEVLQKMKESE